MPGKAEAHAAADLPWLCPNAESLVALAERPAAVGDHLADPAFLLFLLRFASPEPAATSFRFPAERLLSPTLPATAAAHLRATRAGWLDPSRPLVVRLRSTIELAGTLAARLAERFQRVDSRRAAVAARVAAVGLYALATTDRTDGTSGTYAGADEVARRLVARWRLPASVAGPAGHLSLPLRAARFAVPDADLFAVVQLAVGEAERRAHDFSMTRGGDRDEALAHLGIGRDELNGLTAHTPLPPVKATNPHAVALLPNLLRMAAAARRRDGASLVVRLERRVDELHTALAEQAAAVGTLVRDARLRGLAELAAGAGHEINNPLAVIAGHSQRLRRGETDADRVDVLRIIERQTDRIAALIRGLMQFARPSRPNRRRWPVADLVSEIGTTLAAEAESRQIRLVVDAPPADAWADADRDQIRAAVRAVALNALEAVPAGGWVRLQSEAGEGAVAIVVEDGGPGVAPEHREHLFDPFFCGRPAGRGRGLGLPIAWRLATLNGGDVRHESGADGLTRFVVTVPRGAEESTMPERKSA